MIIINARVGVVFECLGIRVVRLPQPTAKLRGLELVHFASEMASDVIPDVTQMNDWYFSLSMEVVFREERGWNYVLFAPAQL